jgi:hypothetical protein
MGLGVGSGVTADAFPQVFMVLKGEGEKSWMMKITIELQGVWG